MIGTSETIPRKGVWLFMLIAFGWSWGLAGGAHLTGVEYGAAIAIIYMMGPALAALTCALIYDRHRFFTALGLSSNPFNKWLLIAFLAPIFIVLLSHLITQFAGGRSMLSLGDAYNVEFNKAGIDPETLPISVEQLAWIQLASAPFVAAIVNTVLMMLTEEVGWRGWLWDRLIHMPFWHHALLVGVIWGVWHAPIVALGHNYPEMPFWGPLIFTAWVILITPIIAFVRQAGGSMVHAAMFHGVLNGIAPITVIIMADQSMPWRGMLGIGGLVALVFGVLLVKSHQAKLIGSQ